MSTPHERVYGALTADQVVLTTGILALFPGGSEDSFTGYLLYLIAKGHPQHDGRIAAGYPDEVRAYQVWMACQTEPTAEWLAAAIIADKQFRIDYLLGIVPAEKWEVPSNGDEHHADSEAGR